jgi:hypothetical protein
LRRCEKAGNEEEENQSSTIVSASRIWGAICVCSPLYR